MQFIEVHVLIKYYNKCMYVECIRSLQAGYSSVNSWTLSGDLSRNFVH